MLLAESTRLLSLFLSFIFSLRKKKQLIIIPEGYKIEVLYDFYKKMTKEKKRYRDTDLLNTHGLFFANINSN